MTTPRRTRSSKVVPGVILTLVAVSFTPAPASAVVTGTTTRATVSSDGSEGNRGGQSPDISADGRFVAFQSESVNLVPGDDDPDNLRQDVFVHDRQSGATTRVSVASNGTPGNNTSEDPVLSADGRYVAFTSLATNLVAGDTNGQRDVFVHDRQTASTTRVSIATDGTQATVGGSQPSISDDGRLVAFKSADNNLTGQNLLLNLNNIFVHDRQTGTTSQVSLSHLTGEEVAGSSDQPAISGNGRYVAYQTLAANVVPNDTNNANDVFVFDRLSSTTTRVSVASDGTQGNAGSDTAAISSDGSAVAFNSAATNLVAADTNNTPDVFVRQAGVTTRVTVASDGSQARPSAGNSLNPDISGDGRYVSFLSLAVLAPGASSGSHYLHDRQKARTTRFNVATDGTHSDGNSSSSERSSLSADGRYIAFEATARNLVPDDTNNTMDVFVRDRRNLPTSPSVSVNDVSVHEGDQGTRTAMFTVSLSKPSTSTVTVDYATADSGAIAPDDYVGRAGTLSFAPGTTSQVVKVPVAGDTLDDNNEDFRLNLSAPTGAYLNDAAGTGFIYDDDPNAGGARLAISDVTIAEGDAGTRAAMFNVSLSVPLPLSVTLSYATVKGTATKPDDFTGKSGTLTFPAGSTSATVKVPVNADLLAEGRETFSVILSNAVPNLTISDSSGQATIIDND